MAPCFVDNWTPLHDACAKGDDEGVQALIDRKADLNAGGHPRQARRCSHTTCGMTPLHVACKTGAEGCVRLLLEANADANRAHAGCQGRGETPLHYATEASHDGCVRLLVEGSADQKANNHGETPLYLACKRQYEGWRDDTPRVLLTAKGCHANAPCTIGPDGWTALHVVCAQYPDVRTAHVLLEGGGDRFVSLQPPMSLTLLHPSSPLSLHPLPLRSSALHPSGTPLLCPPPRL